MQDENTLQISFYSRKLHKVLPSILGLLLPLTTFFARLVLHENNSAQYSKLTQILEIVIKLVPSTLQKNSSSCLGRTKLLKQHENGH